MTIEVGLAIKDIATLNQMDEQLAEYINTIRDEQIHFRGFVQEMVEMALKQGEAKETFLKEIIEYNEQFSTEIQKLENVSLDISETIKILEYIVQTNIG